MTQKLKCNYCSNTFTDLKNISGGLTRHLRDKHLVSAIKREVFTHFTLFEQQQKQKYVCPICNLWETTDLYNVSGIITKHNKVDHQLQIQEFIHEYPKFEYLFKTFLNKKKYKQQTQNNKQQFGIQCLQCGEWRRTINYNHLKTHGMTISQYKEKYNLKKLTSEYSHKKRGIETARLNVQLKAKFGGRLPINQPYVYVQRKQRSYDKLKTYLITQKNIELLSPFLDYKKGNLIKYKCNVCGDTHEKKYDAADTTIRCYTCQPKIKYTSKEEQIIYNYITQQLSVQCECNVKSILSRQRQIDIFIPEYKLGIQINGIFWHSEYSNNRDKNYHLNKTLQCNNLGITLIHIFDDQIRDHLQIVKSRISNMLNKSKYNIHARKCIIKEVSFEIKSQFLNKNHLQGNVQSTINIGAYFNDQLVSVMTFGRPRFRSNYEYELLRFCNKLYTNIPGIASRMFKYFKQKYQPKNIMTYSDIRWSNNKQSYVYDKLGFKYDGLSKPNYYYTYDYQIRQNRFKYRKSELYKMFTGVDLTNKTEEEIMYDNGYDRIWDCGNRRYLWQNI